MYLCRRKRILLNMPRHPNWPIRGCLMARPSLLLDASQIMAKSTSFVRIPPSYRKSRTGALHQRGVRLTLCLCQRYCGQYNGCQKIDRGHEGKMALNFASPFTVTECSAATRTAEHSSADRKHHLSQSRNREASPVDFQSFQEFSRV